MRPTSSKLRGSVFNSLQDRIEGASFLDLFAGSGAVGLEALSRGASSATFIERDLTAIQCIRENLQRLKEEATILKMPVIHGLKRLNQRFDIIYIDPPYALDIHPILELLPPHLSREGIVVVEQSSQTELLAITLQRFEKRLLGDSALHFFVTRDVF